LGLKNWTFGEQQGLPKSQKIAKNRND